MLRATGESGICPQHEICTADSVPFAAVACLELAFVCTSRRGIMLEMPYSRLHLDAPAVVGLGDLFGKLMCKRTAHMCPIRFIGIEDVAFTSANVPALVSL